jgi:hypothetical protein
MIKSYHRFIITTNKDEPIKTSKDDRRNLIIRGSDEKCGDKAYFTRLYEHLKDKNVLMTAYTHFMNEDKYDVKTFNDIPIPKTPYQKELEKLNISPIEAYIKRKAEKNMGKGFRDDEGNNTYSETISMKDLYKKFIIWKNNNNFEYACNDTKFAVRLWRLGIDGVMKGGHTRDGNLVELNYKKINKLYLEEETFNEYYNSQLNNGVCMINNEYDEEIDSDSD